MAQSLPQVFHPCHKSLGPVCKPATKGTTVALGNNKVGDDDLSKDSTAPKAAEPLPLKRAASSLMLTLRNLGKLHEAYKVRKCK